MIILILTIIMIMIMIMIIGAGGPEVDRELRGPRLRLGKAPAI